MLEDVDFLGYVVVLSSFECFNDPTDKGYYDLNIGFPSSEETSEHSKENVTRIPVLIELAAYSAPDKQSRDNRTRLFKSEIRAEFMFSTKTQRCLDEKLLEENKWYFENYFHVVAKELIKSQLENTDYKNLQIHSFRLRSTD